MPNTNTILPGTASAGEYPELPVPVFESWAQGGLLREAGFTADQMRAYADATCAMRASHGQAPAQAAPAAVAEQGPVVHDEELLEQMYWEFDGQRRRTGEERLAFKVKMRFYASEFRRRSDGKMTFAQSVSDDMMNLADRLGSEYDDVDPRAWKHLLVYAPKADSVLEDVARLEFEMQHGSAIAAARKQGANHD